MTKLHVLAGIDNSNLGPSVADYASWIAQTVDVPLTFLHNLEHREPPAASDLSGSIGLGSREHLLDELIELESRRNKLLLEEGKTILHRAKQRAQDAGVANCLSIQRHGPLSETLVELEETIRILVLGARGEDHATDTSTLGNQIESIVRSLHKPILIVNREFTQPKSLLLAYDDSDAAKKALAWLTSSPLYKNITCHLVNVNNDVDTGQAIVNRAKLALEKADVDVKTSVLSGDAQEQLLQYQVDNNIDLIVMGSFGHGRIREMFMGSFTLKMLNAAKIPLLLLR